MLKKLSKKFIKNKKNLSCNITILIISLLILNMLSGNMGLFESFFMRFCSFCLFLSLLTIMFLEKNSFKNFLKKLAKKEKKSIIGLMLIIFSFFVLLLYDSRSLWLSSIPVYLSGLLLIRRAFNNKKIRIDLIVFSSFIYAFFIMIIDSIPIFWSFIQKSSLVLSQGFGNIIGQNIIFGPSVSGLWIFLLFLIFYLSIFILSDKKIKKFIVVLSGLFATWLIYLTFLSVYPFNRTIDLINSQYIFFVLGLIPTILYFYKSDISNFKMSFPKFKKFDFKIYRKAGFWILIFLFISSFCLTTFFYSDSDSNEEEIVVYKKGTLGDWKKPEYGIYGQQAYGMFGLLGKHLNESGYNVEILDQNITNSTFENTKVFVVINLDESFTQDEHKLIWDFVESGGSLLVLGDHTDVGHMMKPLNDLLEPVGIDFRFDSAMPLNHNNQPQWFSCMKFFNHPVTENIPNERWISISIGASLDISKGSFPILVGKHAFSDHGNYLNVDKAFLGDYIYTRDEQLGDVILAAGSYYGNGKVIVFGDTSSFQNSVNMHSYRLVNNVFSWLNSQKTNFIEILQVSIFLSLIFAIIILIKFFTKKSFFSFLLPVVLCLALIFSNTINSIIIDENIMEGSIVYIDLSHGERINLNSFSSDYHINGLNVNLARNNLSSFLLDSFSKQKISKSKGLILIAPTEKFTEDENQFIEKYIYDGGLVILCTGFQEKNAVEGLLDKFDLDILNIPFGSFPWDSNKDDPGFVDVWPIKIENDNQTWSFYEYTEKNVTYHFVVFKKYGSGGFLLIGDSQFLINKNLESNSNYHLGNINFLRNIIKEIKNKGVFL